MRKEHHDDWEIRWEVPSRVVITAVTVSTRKKRKWHSTLGRIKEWYGVEAGSKISCPLESAYIRLPVRMDAVLSPMRFWDTRTSVPVWHIMILPRTSIMRRTYHHPETFLHYDRHRRTSTRFNCIPLLCCLLETPWQSAMDPGLSTWLSRCCDLSIKTSDLICTWFTTRSPFTMFTSYNPSSPYRYKDSLHA